MAKQGGLGDNFYIGGYDLSGNVSALDKISSPVAVQDVTTLKFSAHERLLLKRDGQWQFTTLFDNAAGAEHAALKTLPRTDVVACYLRGTALQGDAAGMVAKQINYDWNRSNTGELVGKVDLQANGFGMEWGENLTSGIRTDTTATTGAAITDTAGTTFGGQAYVQVFSVTGTSVTIDIQSATTSGGVYTSTGLTTSAITPGAAPTAVRLSVANNTTINQFLKVVTTGTFSNAQFCVVFVRNASAVVF